MNIEGLSGCGLEPDLEGKIGVIAEKAGTVFEKDGRLHPILVLDHDVISVLMDSELSKNATAALVQLCRQHDRLVIMITEVWRATIGKDEYEKGKALTPPSERPDREEAACLFCYLGERTIIIQAPIIRHERMGQKLGDWKVMLDSNKEKAKPEGRFA